MKDRYREIQLIRTKSSHKPRIKRIVLTLWIPDLLIGKFRDYKILHIQDALILLCVRGLTPVIVNFKINLIHLISIVHGPEPDHSERG